MRGSIGQVNTPGLIAVENPVAQATASADVCCDGASCELLPTAQAAAVAEVFKALADPTRVRLLQYLASSDSGTACACHLPQALGISQPTLSFHMKKLREAGLVDRDKRGRWVHYTVRGEGIAAARAFLDLPDRDGSTCC